jgi:outer membrane protein OmpA-like peptidoglycan-associated protein
MNINTQTVNGVSHQLFNKGLLGLVCFFCTLPASAEKIDDVVLMESVPSVYQMAKILFPSPTRGLYVSEVEPESEKIAFVLNFKYNSAEVMKESLPYLDAVGKMLAQKNLNKRKLIIEGHADARGGHVYNQGLSELRAQTVKRYLISVHGIDASRLLSIGKGDTELLDSEHPYSKMNRRVQFLAWNT